MNRPVGASSTEVTMSAKFRFWNGSLRSGPTFVMPWPGMLGNEPGGSPAPTGGCPGGGSVSPPGPTGCRSGGESGTTMGGVDSRGGRSAGGLNGFSVNG